MSHSPSLPWVWLIPKKPSSDGFFFFQNRQSAKSEQSGAQHGKLGLAVRAGIRQGEKGTVAPVVKRGEASIFVPIKMG